MMSLQEGSFPSFGDEGRGSGIFIVAVDADRLMWLRYGYPDDMLVIMVRGWIYLLLGR